MEFYGTGLLVLFHVLFAALWFGGAAYQVLIIGRALMQAGPAAGGFLPHFVRQGVGRYYAITGGLAILFGLILFEAERSDGLLEPGRGPGLWIVLGATVAVAAYLKGMLVNLPLERKMKALVGSLKGPPTAEQGKQLAELGARLGKMGALSFLLISIAMLLMLLSRVFV